MSKETIEALNKIKTWAEENKRGYKDYRGTVYVEIMEIYKDLITYIDKSIKEIWDL